VPFLFRSQDSIDRPISNTASHRGRMRPCEPNSSSSSNRAIEILRIAWKREILASGTSLGIISGYGRWITFLRRSERRSRPGSRCFEMVRRHRKRHNEMGHLGRGRGGSDSLGVTHPESDRPRCRIRLHTGRDDHHRGRFTGFRHPGRTVLTSPGALQFLLPLQGTRTRRSHSRSYRGDRG
jgi:hypothetical protein